MTQHYRPCGESALIALYSDVALRFLPVYSVLRTGPTILTIAPKKIYGSVLTYQDKRPWQLAAVRLRRYSSYF